MCERDSVVALYNIQCVRFKETSCVQTSSMRIIHKNLVGTVRSCSVMGLYILGCVQRTALINANNSVIHTDQSFSLYFSNRTLLQKFLFLYLLTYLLTCVRACLQTNNYTYVFLSTFYPYLQLSKYVLSLLEIIAREIIPLKTVTTTSPSNGR